MKPELLILLVCGGALYFSKENEAYLKNLEEEKKKLKDNKPEKEKSDKDKEQKR